MVRTADKKIKDFVNRVRKKYSIDKAIFFGSRARGDYFNNSDYDIILVSNDFKGVFFTERISRLYSFWKYYPLDIEPICYTPEEFEIKRKQYGTVRQAVKEGIEL